MPDEARELYRRIEAAFLRRKAEFFHSEYPDALLAARLTRVLPRLAFYRTENTLMRLVFRGEYLCVEQLLNFGAPSPREAWYLALLAYRLAVAAGSAILLESFAVDRYRLLGEVSEQELQFPVINQEADDPWDAPEPPSDREALAERLLGPLADDCQLHLTPFFADLHLEDTDLAEAVAAVRNVSSRMKVLHVSSSSRALTQQLREQLRARGAQVGELRLNAITTIPRRQMLARLERRTLTSPLRCQLLVEGTLHDWP